MVKKTQEHLLVFLFAHKSSQNADNNFKLNTPKLVLQEKETTCRKKTSTGQSGADLGRVEVDLARERSSSGLEKERKPDEGGPPISSWHRQRGTPPSDLGWTTMERPRRLEPATTTERRRKKKSVGCARVSRRRMAAGRCRARREEVQAL